MLVNEARWFRAQLAARSNDELFPLLNIGSQTAEFRTREQPWLDRHVFAPLARRKGQVLHTDLQKAEGVDLVGDLADAAFRDRLRQLHFRSAICSNLLEHVENREEVARLTAEVVEPGGYLFVSCPHWFPYHPNPIDTMYRPTPGELASLFPKTSIVAEAIVPCGTYATLIAQHILASPIFMTGRIIRGVFRRMAKYFQNHSAPVAPVAELSLRSLLPWLFKTFKASCLVLQKTA